MEDAAAGTQSNAARKRAANASGRIHKRCGVWPQDLLPSIGKAHLNPSDWAVGLMESLSGLVATYEVQSQGATGAALATRVANDLAGAIEARIASRKTAPSPSHRPRIVLQVGDIRHLVQGCRDARASSTEQDPTPSEGASEIHNIAAGALLRLRSHDARPDHTSQHTSSLTTPTPTQQRARSTSSTAAAADQQDINSRMNPQPPQSSDASSRRNDSYSYSTAHIPATKRRRTDGSDISHATYLTDHGHGPDFDNITDPSTSPSLDQQERNTVAVLSKDSLTQVTRFDKTVTDLKSNLEKHRAQHKENLTRAEDTETAREALVAELSTLEKELDAAQAEHAKKMTARDGLIVSTEAIACFSADLQARVHEAVDEALAKAASAVQAAQTALDASLAESETLRHMYEKATDLIHATEDVTEDTKEQIRCAGEHRQQWDLYHSVIRIGPENLSRVVAAQYPGLARTVDHVLEEITLERTGSE